MAETAAELREARRFRVSRELVQHVRDKSTHTHPEGARFVPASEYTDPNLHETERAFLRTVPIVLSTSVEVPEPGSFRAVEVVGVPVLVLRDEGGRARAFLNACPHRGVQLCEETGRIQGGRVVCPYHNWVFRMDGSLERVMKAEHVGDLGGARFDLISMPCEERHGLIFGVLDPHATMDLDGFLGDFDSVLGGLELDKLTHMVRRADFCDPMNWKIALSTYLESYHFTYLHKTTVGPSTYPDTSVLELFGPHALYHVARRELPDLIASNDAEPGTTLGSGESPFASVHFLFPNTVITGFGPTRASHVVTVTPGASVGEQFTDFRLLGVEPSTEEIRTEQELNADVTFLAGEKEDYHVVQQTYKAMAGGIHPGLTFGANEALLTEVHRSWAKGIGRPAPDRPVSGRRV